MRSDYEQLVTAAARGDAEAYGMLVAETSSLVSSIALAIVRDLELSRDVAQEVFLALWRDLKTLRNPASFLPWLRQTTRNRANSAVRTLLRRRQLDEAGRLDEVLPLVIDPRPNAAERIAAREDSEALAEALEALPEETREILTLFYREGQSVAQVAVLLELSEVAVKKRLSRARESLRASLQEHIGETLRRTKPGSAFTAVVIAALPVTSLPAGAAAGLAVSKAGGLGILKLMAPLGGVLAGGMGGVLGVLLGARRWYRDACDEEERRALRRHTQISVAVVLFWAVALPLSYSLTRSRWVAVGWFVCFLTSLALLQHVWLPRIVKRRMDAEMRGDPQSATARRRRERREAILGWTLGIVFGSLGLAVGLWSAR